MRWFQAIPMHYQRFILANIISLTNSGMINKIIEVFGFSPTWMVSTQVLVLVYTVFDVLLGPGVGNSEIFQLHRPGPSICSVPPTPPPPPFRVHPPQLGFWVIENFIKLISVFFSGHLVLRVRCVFCGIMWFRTVSCV